MSEDNQQTTTRERLPAMTFEDGGPPYSEDDDLHSPIVTTSRHKKHKSSSGWERGRSPGAAGPERGMIVGSNGDAQYYDGPGGAVEEYGRYHEPQHRDSNFAKPINRQRAYETEPMSEEEYSGTEDEVRYSKDYSFTIASPDEEMHGKAVALFDFESEHQNELPLKEGQIILVSYRHGEGWLVAEDPRTGESGLVPEEFVRLVRDIEGGLNGLSSVTLDDGTDQDMASPSHDSEANTPVANSQEFSHASKPSNGSTSGDKHPPVQSTFSTSTRDFSPYPLPTTNEDGSAPNQENESPLRKEM